MKKMFVTMLFAGGSLMLFAQNTPTSQGSTTSPATNATMNSTSNYNANWGVGNSTSWSPETTPYWGWNSYGIWNGNSGTAAAGVNAGMNNNMNNGMNSNGAYNSNMNNMASGSMSNMNSSGSYSAYGTPVAGLPMNIQMRYNQDFPSNVNTPMSWSQYGDWFNTYYKNNGRLTQYFYDQRGNGYSLALPVLQTYVPEDIVQKALDKYGANLYSISLVKTPAGSNAYQVSLIHGGQMMMDRLDDNGASVTNSWRTDDMNNGSMNATQSNAAMGNNGNWNKQQ